MPVVGVEQSGGGNTANKAPVGLCLARGCHRMGISTGAETVDGLRFSPAARLGVFAGGGGRTERRWKHRKQSPSGALFSSRVSPYRNQYRGRSRGRFKVFPSRKAGGFLPVAGGEQSGGEQHRTSATAVVNTHNPLLSTEYRDAAKHKVQLRLDLCDLEHFPPSGYRAGDRDVQFAG